MGSGSAPRPGRLYPRERPSTYCTGGWVAPRAGLDERRISSPTGIRSRFWIIIIIISSFYSDAWPHKKSEADQWILYDTFQEKWRLAIIPSASWRLTIKHSVFTSSYPPLSQTVWQRHAVPHKICERQGRERMTKRNSQEIALNGG